jgi:hypothetical protein
MDTAPQVAQDQPVAIRQLGEVHVRRSQVEPVGVRPRAGRGPRPG